MAWSQEDINSLAQSMAASRTASGSMGVQAPRGTRAPIQPKYEPRQGVVQAAVTKVSNIAKQAPAVAYTVGKAIVGTAIQQVKELPGEIYRTSTKVIPTLMGGGLHTDITMQNQALESLQKTQDSVTAQYKAGRMSKEDYNKALKELSDGFSNISKRAGVTITEADPKKAVNDFVDTAAFLFTVGSGRLISGATKSAEALSTATKVNTGIETALKKVPGGYFTKILEKEGGSAAKIALQNSLGENAKLTASKLFIKYPLTYHTAFDDAGHILESLSKGDLQGAAGRALWGATALLEGPIAAAFKGVKKFGISTKQGVFGTNGFYDELSSLTKDADRASIMRHVNGLKTSDPKAYDEFVNGWGKSVQAMNLFTARDDVKMAAGNISEWFYKQGNDISNLTGSEVFDSLRKYGKAIEAIHKDLKMGLVEGIPHDKTGQVLLGRFDRKTRDEFVAGLEKAGAPRKGETIKDARERMLKFLEGASEEQVVWTHNAVLYNRVKTAIEEGRTVKQIREAIQSIDAGKAVGKGWSKETRKLMADGGYVPVIPKRITGSRYIAPEKAGKIATGFAEKGDPLFDVTVKPLPGLGGLGSAIKRAGLSPEDTTASVQQSLRGNLDDALKDVKLDVPIGDSKGKWVSDRLSKYMESLPISPTLTKNIVAQDARHLRIGEIANALGVDRATARTVQKSILNSYTTLPMAMRGLGDKLVDYSYNIPLIGDLQRSYARVQGALRYSWNPFFRLQETAETEILSQMLSGGKVPQGFGANGVISLFFKKTATDIDNAVQALTKKEVFSGTLTGMAADDVVIGRITANMTKYQKKSLAGFALKIADKKGVDIDTLLNENYDEVVDALRVVVQYPRKGGINSPLARTLNVAFFPARYNLKVAGLAATTLAKAPPAVQVSIVNSMYDFSTWLKSDEGTQWQSDNQDAIQAFRWLTPYNSIDSAMKILTGGKPESIGELGLMGGLPFGLISQMIDSQTSFELNTPYVDLKTGKLGPDYTPITDKARAATALQDLIGMAFSYPGRILGLPGKAELIRNGTKAFVKTDSGDYEITYPEDRLTDLQKKQYDYLNKDKDVTTTETNPVFDGYSWNKNGYYIPVDIVKKSQAMTSKPAPVPVTLPNKKAKSGPKPKKIARIIENR